MVFLGGTTRSKSGTALNSLASLLLVSEKANMAATLPHLHVVCISCGKMSYVTGINKKEEHL